MKSTAVRRAFFKTAIMAVVSIFALEQAASAAGIAGDGLDIAYNRLEAERSQTFAPAYLQEQQSIKEEAVGIAQETDSYQYVSVSLSGALATAADEAVQADELSVDLRGPMGEASGGQSAGVSAETASAIEETAASVQELEPGDLGIMSITTAHGDVISYADGRIDHIERPDGTRISDMTIGSGGELIEAVISGADNVVWKVALGRTVSREDPDGTLYKYNDDGSLAQIVLPYGEAIGCSYEKDAAGDIVGTVLSDSEKTARYGKDGLLVEVRYGAGKVVEYDRGMISALATCDGRYIFGRRISGDTVEVRCISFVDDSGNAIEFDDGGVVSGIRLLRGGATAGYGADGVLVDVESGSRVVSKADLRGREEELASLKREAAAADQMAREASLKASESGAIASAGSESVRQAMEAYRVAEKRYSGLSFFSKIFLGAKYRRAIADANNQLCLSMQSYSAAAGAHAEDCRIAAGASEDAEKAARKVKDAELELSDLRDLFALFPCEVRPDERAGGLMAVSPAEAKANLPFLEAVYDASANLKELVTAGGAKVLYDGGLPGAVIGIDGASSYDYILSASGDLEGVTVDRDGIKRIYDRYGNLKSLSLGDAAKIIYEDGRISQIRRADGAVIRNMAFRESGELDGALISYPDGSLAVYRDAALLQMIGASGASVDFADGKIGKMTMDDGSEYTWSYSGGDIVIADQAQAQRRTYSTGLLTEIEDVSGSGLVTKYYYDEALALAGSEIYKDGDMLYEYKYSYEDALTVISDASGNVQAYTKEKKLSYIVDSTGRKYTYHYVEDSDDGFEISSPDGSTACYGPDGDLILITEPDGTVIEDIVFDERGGPESFTYIKGGYTYVVEGGSIKEVVSSAGVRTLYYGNGLVESITDAQGDTAVYKYFVRDVKECGGEAALSGSAANAVSVYEAGGYERIRLSADTMVYGDGSDGAKHVSSDERLAAGVYDFTSLKVDAGKTMIVSPGTVIRVLGEARIEGTVFCGGSLDISACRFSVGPSGSVTGKADIKCDTIDNDGVITGNACLTGALTAGAVNADRDGIFTADSHSYEYNQSGSGSASPIITFPSCHIASCAFSAYGDGNAGSGSCYFYVRSNGSWVSTGAGGSGSGNPGWSFSVTGSTIYGNGGTGWDNVDAVMAVMSASSSGGVARVYMQEMQAFIGRPSIEYVSGDPGVVNATSSSPAAAVGAEAYPASGVFESPVIETGALEFGDIECRSDIPAGTGLAIQTRSGDTAVPDISWSPWADGSPEQGSFAIVSPAAKFLQYRLILSSEDGSATPVIGFDIYDPIDIEFMRAPNDGSEIYNAAYITVTRGDITHAFDSTGTYLWTQVCMDGLGPLDLGWKMDALYIPGLAFDVEALELMKARIAGLVLDETEKAVYLRKDAVVAELTSIRRPDGSEAEYSKGKLKKVKKPDGDIIVNITYEAGRDPSSYTLSRSGTDYIVEDGVLTRMTTEDGDIICYYPNGAVRSVENSSGRTEYSYDIEAEASCDYTECPTGSFDGTAVYSQGEKRYLELNRPLLDLGDGSDGDFVSDGDAVLSGVKNYRSFYVKAGDTITADDTLVIKCQGSVVIEGSIRADGCGYTSGYGIGENGWDTNMDGYVVPPMAGGPGGGGAGYAQSGGRGGNGARHMAWGYGRLTINGIGAFGGSAYGDSDLTELLKGSRGGNGGNGTYYESGHAGIASGGLGGAGGGAVKIVASEIVLSGTISADGLNGQDSSELHDVGGAGGGGSGGSIWLAADSFLISGSVSVKGGNGGLGSFGGYGGKGSDGRIRLDYSTLTGTAPASANKKKLAVSASTGTFESTVMRIDAREISSIAWSQAAPAGTEVLVQTRTGPTEVPDGSWSGWSDPVPEAGCAVTSPADGYIQYRLTLSTSDGVSSPRIDMSGPGAVTICYARDPAGRDEAADITSVHVRENGAASTYGPGGVNVDDPQDGINIADLFADPAGFDDIEKDLSTRVLSETQKIITVYDKGNNDPVETVTAGHSITYYEDGLATEVVNLNGDTLVAYRYDDEKDIVDVEFVDARARLEANYASAVSEIATQREAALAKLARAESDSAAAIEAKSADMLGRISSERQRLSIVKGMYDPALFDLSEFDRAFSELDGYEAELALQQENARADLESQVELSRQRIESDAATAMAELIRNDYDKIFGDIVQKESVPIIYHYYRKVLGRDPGEEELAYWTGLAKDSLSRIDPAAIAAYIKAMPEYAGRLTAKEEIVDGVRSFFAQYVSASTDARRAMLASLGLDESDAVETGSEDIDKIVSWLDGQPLHFGDSAIRSVVSLLGVAGIAASFQDIGKRAIEIDILTGVITAQSSGDLLISMYAMRKAAGLSGLTLHSKKIDYAGLSADVVSGPVIAHIDGRHYVIVTSVDDLSGTVAYTDPTVGSSGQSITVSRAEFMEAWKGYTLSKPSANDAAKVISVTREKSIRGSGWWSKFWKGIVKFFQKVAAPVGAFLMMLAPVNPVLGGIGAVLSALNVVVQTVSFVVRTGTLMDVAWAAVTAIGSAIGSQILPNIYDAVGGVSSGIARALGQFSVFAPAKGVFTSVMPVFNTLTDAVHGVASGIGAIFDAEVAAPVASSIVETVISAGVRLGADAVFRSMHIDPSLSDIAGALMTGAVMGMLMPGTDVVSEALRYGTLAGTEELGKAAGLDPEITHLAAIMSGSLVGGSLQVDDKTIGYDELLRGISPNIAAECSYIGITKAGELLGIDPRISYLAGVGLRSTINAGLTHDFMPDVIWGLVQSGLLNGITSVGLQWAYEEIGVNPLFGAMTANAIGAAFEAILNRQNIFLNIGKQAGEGIFSLFTLGGYGDNPWSQAVYISQVLDFSRLVQERGLLEALETYATSIFHQQTINLIVKDGGIYDMLTNRAVVFTDDNGIQRKRLYADSERKYYIDINMANNAIIEKKDRVNGVDVITKQQYGIDVNGKLVLLGRTVEEIYSDNQKKISTYDDKNNLTLMEIFDKDGNAAFTISPLEGQSSISLKDGSIYGCVIKDIKNTVDFTFENGKMAYTSADMFGSDATPEPTYFRDPNKTNLENAESYLESMMQDYDYRLSGKEIFGASGWEVAMRELLLTSSKFQLTYGNEASFLQSSLSESERQTFDEYATFLMDSIINPHNYNYIPTADELALWAALQSPIASGSPYGFSLTVVHGMCVPGQGSGFDTTWADNIRDVKVSGQNFVLTVDTWNRKGTEDDLDTGMYEYMRYPDKRRDVLNAVKQDIKFGWEKAQGQGIPFDIAAHSFGTVIVYEALGELRTEMPDMQIRNVFFMGSPLGYFVESGKVAYDQNTFDKVTNVVNIYNPNDSMNLLRAGAVSAIAQNPLLRILIQSDAALGNKPLSRELKPMFSIINDYKTDIAHGAMWQDPKILRIVEESGIFTN